MPYNDAYKVDVSLCLQGCAVSIVHWIQGLNVESVMAMETILTCVILMVAVRFWLFAGLCSYISVAIIVSNIEVMRGVKLALVTEPMALGNIAYGSVAIAIAIATELFGGQRAKSCVGMGFFAMSVFAILITIGIGYAPIDPHDIKENMRYLAQNHAYMEALFSPSLALSVASMIAFLVSSYTEIISLLSLKRLFVRLNIKGDGLRIMLSSNIALCVDLFLMNYLVWIVFLRHEIGISDLFSTYILGSYLFRVMIACLTYPMVSICKQAAIQGARQPLVYNYNRQT